MTIKLPREQIEKLKDKIKSEIIQELESRRVRLDKDDIDFVLTKTKNLIAESVQKVDNHEITKSLVKEIRLSEAEKAALTNRSIIWNKEVRADFINDVLKHIRTPSDGKPGKKGESGKDGEDYKLTKQDRTDIGKTIEGVVTTDVFNQRYLQLIKDIKSGKIKLPAHGGVSGPEIVKKINAALGNDGWQSAENIYKDFLFVNPTGDDSGLLVKNGQLSVGDYENGYESVFGGGDSHTNGMVVFSTEDGTTYIDNTEAAASDSSSTYETFGGFITAGAIDYIGGDHHFCGIKLKTAATLTPGSGAVTREFWNGSAWEVFTMMATKSDAPYTQRADNIGTVAGSEQVRFGECGTQSKTTVNGVEKYWIRFRITSNISAVGEIEQIKLHTNRFEINADGVTEYFGNSIYQKDLAMQWANTIQLDGLSPANESITFADNSLKLDYADNEFANNTTDGRGGVVIIPQGMDTSRGVTLEVLWTPMNDAAGDTVYQLITYQTSVGDVLTASNAATVETGTATIESGSDNLLTKTVMLVDVQHLVPGEMLVFGLKRLGSDAADTYAGNVALINIRAIGYFWHP